MADSKISQLTNYTPAIDTDELAIVDKTSAITKKITWVNIKATLKTYFDTLYSTAVKAIGTELDTGTDDAKFATALALKNSKNIPSVAPSTSGNVLTSDGTNWTSATAGGGGDFTKVASGSISVLAGATQILSSVLDIATDGVYKLILKWEYSANNGNLGLRINNISGSEYLRDAYGYKFSAGSGSTSFQSSGTASTSWILSSAAANYKYNMAEITITQILGRNPRMTMQLHSYLSAGEHNSINMGGTHTLNTNLTRLDLYALSSNSSGSWVIYKMPF